MKEFRRHHRWRLEIGRNIRNRNHGSYNTCRNGLELEAGMNTTFSNLLSPPRTAKNMGKGTRPEQDPLTPAEKNL